MVLSVVGVRSWCVLIFFRWYRLLFGRPLFRLVLSRLVLAAVPFTFAAAPFTFAVVPFTVGVAPFTFAAIPMAISVVPFSLWLVALPLRVGSGHVGEGSVSIRFDSLRRSLNCWIAYSYACTYFTIDLSLLHRDAT